MASGSRSGQTDLTRLCWTLIPVAGLTCLFGVIDDCRTLRSRAKLVLQFLAASLTVLAGASVNVIVVFDYPIQLVWWGIPLTICRLMVGIKLALNLIHGLDGWASLVGLSTAAMIGIIALGTGASAQVAAVAMVWPPPWPDSSCSTGLRPSIFLGDSGSTLLGLVIGVLGIQGNLKSSATLLITAPVVLMTLPKCSTCSWR